MRSLLAAVVSVLAASAHADILNVPGDFPTIQAALDAAQDGDEIVLAPGVYESPGVLFDRSITLTIRSTDPTDAQVVASTVLTDATDAGVLTVRNTNSDFSIQGLTFARPAEQTSDPFIRIESARVIFSGCRFDGGDATTRSGGIIGSDSGNGGDSAFVTIRNSELFGDVGRMVFGDTQLVFDGVTVRDGNASFSWFENNSESLTVEDSVFVNLEPAAFHQFDITNSSGTPAVFERVTIADVPGRFLRARDIALRDVTVERSGTGRFAFDDGEGFIDADALTIDGLTVRDCVIDRFGIDIAWFINANDRLNVKGAVFERNAGADIWLHGINGDFQSEYLIEDSTFRDNLSNYAIVEVHNSGTFRGCVFERNIIEEDPQGLFSEAVGVVAPFGFTRGDLNGFQRIRVDRCEFRYNSGGRGPFGTPGRAVRNNVLVTNTVFEGNTAEFGGAAAQGNINTAAVIYSEGQGWITFRQCVFVGNSSDQGGVHFGGARYESCVIANNTGGTASLGFGSAAVIDSIVVTDGSAVPTVSDTVFDFTFDPAFVDSLHSIVPPDAQGTSTTSLDPLFVRPPNNGGDGWGDDPATPDIDESLNDDFGDLRLRPGSPAIDADSRGIMRFFETDLDGNARLRDDPGIPDDGRNGKVDIGAYEFQGSTCLADVNQDGSITPNDFNAWILAFNANSPLADQNRDGEVRQNDFNAWILNFNAGC
ncbi:MAG: GC-type dockerin domain-anchored protein [Planctomycetota bacterium]